MSQGRSLQAASAFWSEGSRQHEGFLQANCKDELLLPSVPRSWHECQAFLVEDDIVGSLHRDATTPHGLQY